eukprot:CAMPEP_0172435382 /NCGR_PEP_ID=MMETSP1064-20121228/71146_1 /TAXON_ID=202472 /ORGANISM="Aulacoseira subarctica , Strain CCAP 1002/5" /LENGTH=252 /DNA_ID=CAMNT_0013183691 /DNA_START=41 /DNA_END=799 /DNA_ORIENTATION=-
MDTSEEKMMCMNNRCTKESLKLCTRCRVAWYCGKECQVHHWRRHKKCCKMISSSPDMHLRYVKAYEGYKIGLNQKDSGEFDQALLTFQESLEIFKEFQDDSDISGCYFEIGSVLSSKKQYEEALVNYRKALEIFRDIHGENHGKTCVCYEAIGNVMSDQGRYDDAYIGYGKALAIRLELFGENHMEIGQSYYNIDLAQFEKGDYDGVLVSLQKAKAIYTRELGVEHPRTVQRNVCIDFCQKRMNPSKKNVQL